MANKPNLLLIPESRKRPITESLLYKQIKNFFWAEGLESKFEIVFISINDGIVDLNLKSQKSNPGFASQELKLPPQRFRSGKLWIKKNQIAEMAQNISQYLYKTKNKYNKRIAYVRGSYLEAVRLARTNSGMEIEEIFTERQLKRLKKKGIMWMKVGLRIPKAFQIFERRIKEFSKEEDKQLKFNF